MSRIGFIFPGQGSQFLGMGKDFFDSWQECREIYEMASDVTGMDIAELCFAKSDLLNITEYTQIAMFTTTMAIFEAVRKAGIAADIHAGLSLGEYAALAASEVLDLEDAFDIVRKRGLFMQSAYPVGGGMAAVIGLASEVVERICDQTYGEVSVANYNCPGQIVITGADEAVKIASKEMKMNGAKRIIPLKVSGPFHSPLLQQASEHLKDILKNTSFGYPVIPYISNVTANFVLAPGETRKLLSEQVVKPVRWEQSVRLMIDQGIDTFVEIGPGKALAGFLRKIDRTKHVVNIQHTEDLSALQPLL